MKTFVQNVKCSVISSVFSKENNWLCSWVGSQWGISCCSVAHLSTPEGLDLSSTDMMHVIIRNVQQFVQWLLTSLFHMFSYFCPFFTFTVYFFSFSAPDTAWCFLGILWLEFLSFFLSFLSLPSSFPRWFLCIACESGGVKSATLVTPERSGGEFHYAVK